MPDIFDEIADSEVKTAAPARDIFDQVSEEDSKEDIFDQIYREDHSWRTGPLYEPARLNLGEQPQLLPSPSFPSADPEDTLRSAQESFAVAKPDPIGTGLRERAVMSIKGLGVKQTPQLLLMPEEDGIKVVAPDGQRYDASQLLDTKDVTPEGIGRALGAVEAAQILRRNKLSTPEWLQSKTIKEPTEAAEQEELSRWENARNAFGRGALGGIISAVQATAKLDEIISARMPTHSSREIIKARQAMLDEAQKAVRMAYPLDPRYKDEFIANDLPSGAGSILPFVLSGSVGGPVASAALGSLMTAQQEYEAARAAGMSEEDARKSFGVGALIGATEAFGAGRKGAGIGKGSFARQFLTEANEEGAQEALQQFLSNVNAIKFTGYDMQRNPMDGVLKGYAVGAILGGAVKIPGLAAEKLAEIKQSEDPAAELDRELEKANQLEQPVSGTAGPPQVETISPDAGIPVTNNPIKPDPNLQPVDEKQLAQRVTQAPPDSQQAKSARSLVGETESATEPEPEATSAESARVEPELPFHEQVISSAQKVGEDGRLGPIKVFISEAWRQWQKDTGSTMPLEEFKSELLKNMRASKVSLSRLDYGDSPNDPAREKRIDQSSKESEFEDGVEKFHFITIPAPSRARWELVEYTAKELATSDPGGFVSFKEIAKEMAVPVDQVRATVEGQQSKGAVEIVGDRFRIVDKPAQPNRDKALESAYKIAEDIAARVTQGQGDTVREAAFAAAFAHAQNSIEKTGNFNPSFMTAEAQRAAGTEASGSAESVDEEERQPSPEETDLQTPAVQAKRSEHIELVRDALSDFKPEEAEILLASIVPGGQAALAKERGVEPQAISNKLARLAPKFRAALAKRGITREDAISVGPGAANMAEFDPLRTTSTKNAVVDQERQDRGEEPIMAPARQALGVPWEEAETRIEKNPNTGPALVAELNENPRAVTNVEEAILLHHKITVSNELRTEMARMLDENATEEERTAAGAQVEFLLDALDKVDQATKAVGTEWGRAGRFRQQLANDDFTLSNMLQRARVAKKGEKLTAEEQRKIKEQHDKIQALEKKISNLEAKQEAEQIKATFQALIQEVQKEAKTAAKEGKSFLDTLKAGRDDALKNLRSKMGRTSAGIDPTILYDVARIGAYHIANGAVKLAEFTAKIIADVGEWIRPHVDEVFEASQKLHEANKSAFKTPGRKKAGKAPIEAAKENAQAGKDIDQKTVFDLAREKVKSGLKDLDAVMNAVYKDLEPIYPGITVRDVRDAFSGYGKVAFPSKEEDLTKLRELRRLAQLASAIEDAQKKVAPKKTGMQRDQPTQAIRDKMKELQKVMREQGIETTSPEQQLRSANQARATALRNQIEDLDRQLRTGEKAPKSPKIPDSPEVERLRAERDAMKEELRRIEAEENPKKSPEQVQLERDKKAIQTQIQKLQDRIKAGDYAPRPKKTPLMDTEKEKLLFEREKVKQEFMRGVFEQQLKNRTIGKKIAGSIAEVTNTVRAIKTSIDLSGLLRQGGFIVFGHPIRAIRTLPTMVRALLSERAQFSAMEEIRNRPNAPLYARSKLYISDERATSLSKMEEEFMGRWAPKIPGIAASQRAYTVLLNRLRADSFDALTATLTKSGTPTPEEAKAIAQFVNIATGRGNLGKRFEPAASLLNTIFFAPRYVASRFQLLLGVLTGFRFGGGSTRTRKLIAIEYARYLSGVSVVYALAALAMDDDDPPIETDLTSTDFGKIRFGNTRLDPMSGLLQVTVFLSREAQAIQRVATQSKEKKPKYGTGVDVLGRFLRTKLSPAVGSIVNLMGGKNVVGETVTPGSEALQSIQPISFGEIYDTMKEQGVAKGTALSLLSILGMGVQTYEAKKK